MLGRAIPSSFAHFSSFLVHSSLFDRAAFKILSCSSMVKFLYVLVGSIYFAYKSMH